MYSLMLHKAFHSDQLITDNFHLCLMVIISACSLSCICDNCFILCLSRPRSPVGTLVLHCYKAKSPDIPLQKLLFHNSV